MNIEKYKRCILILKSRVGKEIFLYFIFFVYFGLSHKISNVDLQYPYFMLFLHENEPCKIDSLCKIIIEKISKLLSATFYTDRLITKRF